VPQAGTLSPNSLPALKHYPSIDAMIGDSASICSAKPVKVPGDYVFMLASGNLTAGTFATAGGDWFEEEYQLGTPAPHPTPTPGVTPTPSKGQRLYFYYGTYHLVKSNETGCAFLIATQSGKVFKGDTYNALGLGTVVTNVKYLRIGDSFKNSGTLTMTISHVTPTSGSGSATLLTGKGKPYDSATISLTGRISIP
jgi:hypothetical protein